ncbi:MAG: winged helix-turn-helix transcriptional regulator [Gammaproteobacteria bacterium]|nr:winged helix-turn-helix transcriptional regulator [Gammaproteobacteria bacterium]
MATAPGRAGDKATRGARPAEADLRHWTFLSNHGHVLVCLARDPDARLRDVAQSVGITERAVQKIVSDLEDAGVVQRVRDGRRNRYRLFLERPLRHPLEAHRNVGSLLGMVLSTTTVRRLTSGGEPAAD